MASIQLGGINLDVAGIVSQLMDLESRPLTDIQTQITDYKAQLSTMGRLKSVLSTFQSAMEGLSSLDKFEAYKVSTSESETAPSYTATGDKTATAGIYSIDVNSLATVNKLGQTPGTAYTAAQTFSSADTLDLSVGASSISVAIDGKTITEVRDAINAAAKAQSPETGLSASVIQSGTDAFQLVITATETGEDNKVVVTSNTASTALNLSEIQTATNASVDIDGYTVTSNSNTLTNAISGITLNLLAETGTTASTLTISRDTDSVKKSVNELVSSYNALNSSIKIYKAGDLKGDSSLNMIQNMTRNILNTSAGLSSAYNYLSEVGVTTNAKTGELELDSTVLDKAIENDYEAVSKLFAEQDSGVAFRMDALVTGFLKYDGIVATREDGINARIDRSEDSVLNWEYRLEKIEARYLKQYSDLDSLIGQMNSTSSSLAGQLASLPGFTR